MWISIMLCSALFFALNHIIKKKILEDADVLDMMIVNGCIGFIMILPFAGAVSFDVSGKNLILIMLNALLAYSGSVLLNIAYKNCEISTVSPLLNINPLFIIVISYFVLNETLNSVQFSGVFLILAGGYIITLKDIRSFFQPFTSMPKKYFLVVLGTLLLWSFCPVINRLVLFEVDSLSYLFFFVQFIFVIQVVMLVVTRRYSGVIQLTKKSWPLLCLACFCWIVSDLLHLAAIAVPTAVVSLVMPAKRVSNLFTVVLGGNLFKERNLVLKAGACTLMLAGLFIIGLFS